MEEDSLFALAYYRLAAAAEYSALRDDIAVRAMEKAFELGDRLSPRDRSLLDASLAFRRGDANEAERLYRSYLGRYPDDVQAWFELGEILFHLNPLRGRPTTESREAFGRVLDLEPDNGTTMLHLIRLDALEGRIAALDSLTDRYAAIAGGGERALEVRAIQAFAHGDAEREAEVLEGLQRAPDITLLFAVRSVTGTTGGPDDWERLIRLMTEPGRSPQIRGQGYLWLGCVRLATGRWREAQEELDRARGLAGAGAGDLLPVDVLVSCRSSRPVTGRSRVCSRRRARYPPPPARERSIAASDHQGVEPFARSYLLGLLGSRLGRTPTRAVIRRRAGAHGRPAERRHAGPRSGPRR